MGQADTLTNRYNCLNILPDPEDVMLTTNDNHFVSDHRSRHHDFSHRIAGEQFISSASFDDEDVAVFAGKVELSI